MSNLVNFEKRFSRNDLEEFAAKLKQLSRQIGFKVSSRGWCYIMEQNRFINKNQFDKVENLINKCRRDGLLPVDFVAEDALRGFSGVETASRMSLKSLLRTNLKDVLEGYRFHTPDWWEGEEVYVQMVVEKIDLKTLFEPVCSEYHIPIANSAGWSSILQRAEYARRFKEAERRGLRCVLLYCGDHDPDGLRISDTLRKNLEQVSEVLWFDMAGGYDPRNLQIERFGLNYNFIIENNYTWIDNLITGSGKNLADPHHPNFKLDYVQNYLADIGERKCEANAVVTTPDAARELCRENIENFLGDDALERFSEKEDEVREKYEELLDQFGLKEKIADIIEIHDADDESESEDDEDEDDDNEDF